MVTNEAGIDWLRRHYPNHRVHKVWYREQTPWHMDTTIVPLRAGLVLFNPVRTPLQKAQYELFEKNELEVVHKQYFNFVGTLGWWVAIRYSHAGQDEKAIEWLQRSRAESAPTPLI